MFLPFGRAGSCSQHVQTTDIVFVDIVSVTGPYTEPMPTYRSCRVFLGPYFRKGKNVDQQKKFWT